MLALYIGFSLCLCLCLCLLLYWLYVATAVLVIQSVRLFLTQCQMQSNASVRTSSEIGQDVPCKACSCRCTCCSRCMGMWKDGLVFKFSRRTEGNRGWRRAATWRLQGSRCYPNVPHPISFVPYLVPMHLNSDIDAQQLPSLPEPTPVTASGGFYTYSASGVLDSNIVWHFRRKFLLLSLWWKESCKDFTCQYTRKIVPVYAVKAYMWSRGIVPLILNLSTRLRWMVVTFWPLYLRNKLPLCIE
jgi:hypothetical protein